jgi:hypothetical protein
LLELRKLRKARGGIDVAKLNKGDIKKKKKRAREEGEEGGLKKGVPEDEECVFIVIYIADNMLMSSLGLFRDAEEKEARTRRVIRSNNFTQQTNALDVDKHMFVTIS